MKDNNHPKFKEALAVFAFAAMAANSAAAQNEYGGYDIVDTPGAVEQDYANVRGWTVTANYVDGNFAFCSAWKNVGNSPVSIGFDNMQWQLAVPIVSRDKEWSGGLEVDGDQRYASGSSTANNAIAWLGLSELDRLKRGNQAIVSVGKYDFDFSLAGVTASTLKVSECVQNAGQVPTRTSGNTTQAQTGNLHTARANCETVFGGVFGCTLTQHSKEGSYREVITVDSDTPDMERYLIKQIDDTQGEVWVEFSDQPQVWNYKGYWEPASHDVNCIEPAANQGLAVQEALGHDAWMLCIR
ncbi:hypothetical protein [Halocynthiibacter namhaensis]|uniref:hypothetical protein n=1 Tax=Halocynthiibacter namhaensis TaxID=1290553 RepID=UPI00057989EA|nr:hypothetical protein [Halocynthiibacter namhaensis]